MRARVLGRYQQLTGIPAPAPLPEALDSALLLRASLDDHHPWSLHPARTVLILLDDAGEVDAATLAAAAGVDSIVAEWHGSPLPSGHGAGALAAAVPVPVQAGELLLELLVAAERRVRLIACAERLDHARHLHMFQHPDRSAFLAQVRDVYLPVAERTDALIARRLQRWADSFARGSAAS